MFAASSADTVIAKVGGEGVVLRDLLQALAEVHGAMATEAKVGVRDFRPALDRLVDARLIQLEARNMGLQELPEYTSALANYKEMALTAALRRRVTDAVKVSEKDVERRYRDLVREWQVSAVLFTKEEDARKLVDLAKKGSFDKLAAQALADGKATGTGKPEFLPEQKMLPEVVKALKQTRRGGLAGPVAVPGGFTVMRLDGERYPEDPALRAKVATDLRTPAEETALQKYFEGLVKRYATLDEKAINELDFEAETPGLEALAKDQRVLVRIKGDKPVTVADMVAEMQRKMYHGVQEGVEKKKLNSRKGRTLESILSRRLPQLDARNLKLQDTPAYRKQVADFADRALFGLYVQKTLEPSVTVPDTEARAYYESHKAEYTKPEFLKLESLGFTAVKPAQQACEKLRAGTDYRWLAANADDQLTGDGLDLHFEGKTYGAGDFAPELTQALAGAAAGDCRTYSDAKGGHYAIRVLERQPVQVQPFEETRDQIEGILAAQKLREAVKDVAAKLRQSYPVEVLIERIGQ
jgi:parvulin-like peptidyl-prolyl isomerase